MKTLLGFVTALTLLACVYLSLSYLILKGSADLTPLVGLVAFVIPCAVTFVALAVPLSGPWRGVPLVAGAAIIWFSWSSIQHMLASSHFEGYAFVLGAMGIVQGVLTIIAFSTLPGIRTAGLS